MPLAFVTGSTGFVGLNLVSQLAADGWDVVALHRSTSARVDRLRDLGADCVEGDIVNRDVLREAMPQQVDAVFHVAGDTSLWQRGEDAQTLVNVAGTRNVVKAALERRAKRLVYTSSAVAFGLHSGRITEKTPVSAARSPINYVRTKAQAEREVRRGLRNGLQAVIVNPPNILGRYDYNNWSKLFSLIERRRLPGVPDGGGSFCDAGAVAQAHIAAAEQGKPGNNYLLGGVDQAYVSLVQAAARKLNRRVLPRPMPARALNAYAQLEERLAPFFRRAPDITRDTVTLLSSNLYCDPSLAQSELGYAPVALDAMLDTTIGWMREEGLLKAR